MFHTFALQGAGNSGRSATLLKLYNDLKSRYPSTTVKFIHNNSTDIAVVMTEINGNVVGIETRGEPGKRLKNSLNAFVAAKCDIIFCPCRTKGMTLQWIKTLPLQYTIRFIQHNSGTSNSADANAAIVTSLMRQAGI